MREAMAAVEAHSIREALERSGYHRAAAAKALGIHKATLFRLVKKLGISLPEEDGRTLRSKRRSLRRDSSRTA